MTPARAQLVTDGGTNTYDGTTFTTGSSVDIGTSADGTLLILTNAARVTNGITYIGRNAGSDSNRVVVTGSGSRWAVLSDLYIGFEGARNRLEILAGGFVSNKNTILGGNASTATENALLVAGTNSTLLSHGDFLVGLQGGFNSVVISNGGLVMTRNAPEFLGSYLGFFSSAPSNEVLVTGEGARWSNAFDIFVGYGGAGNRLTMTNGGRVNSDALYLGYGGTNGVTSGSGNTVAVRGAGSVLSNRSFLYLGDASSSNTLLVTDGGRVITMREAFLGNSNSSSGNLAFITGTNSVWLNRSNLFVGYNGSDNRLIVSNAGTVIASNRLVLGNAASSVNNRIDVAGGALLVTNRLGTGILQLLRGWLYFTGGNIDADSLDASSASAGIQFDEGTLTTRATTINNGTRLTVGNGSGSAVFNLIGTGAHGFSNGLLVNANGRVSVSNSNVTSAAGIEVRSGGVLELANDIAVTGPAPLTLSGTGIGGGGVLRNLSGSNQWDSLITLNAQARFNSDSGTLVIRGGVNSSSNAPLLVGGAGNTRIEGVLGSGIAGLTKDGAGELQLAGSSGNTFVGPVTVNGGTLLLNKSAGYALPGGSLTIQSNAVVRYGAAGQIAPGLPLVLNGGKLDLNGFAPAGAFGSLTLSADSTLDFGIGGTQTVEFASLASYNPMALLYVLNWQGSRSGGGTDRVVFTGGNGVAGSFLANVRFDGYGPGALLLAGGEIVPVPEPGPVFALAALTGLVAWRERRRFFPKR